VQPVANATGELLLSCNDTEYNFDHGPLTVTILVNAQHPGAAPGPIPGTTPVVDHPGIVAGDGEAARRIANAWLLVNGGRDLHDQLEILHALTIAKLALAHQPPTPAQTLTAKTRACLLASGFQARAGEAPFGPYVISAPSRDVPPPITSDAEIYIFNNTQAAIAGNPVLRWLSTRGPPSRIERHGPATVTWYGTPNSSNTTAVNRCLPR